MKCLFSGLTDPGLLRTVNQDAFYIDPSGRFFIVADGMGGHAGGQEASRIATEAIQQHLDEKWFSPDDSRRLLEMAFMRANRAILSDQSRHPERSDMGTTAVVVIFRQGQTWCAHVGDSRLYRLRGAQLDQITEDHTWVARAMKMGELSSDQARVHPWRHILSKCLGREDLRHVDVAMVEARPSDRLLLCSDGLTEELSDHLIAFHLKSIRSCEKLVSALVNAAKDKGGRDNITVVVITIESVSASEEMTALQAE
ncbi:MULTISPECIES: protein phosphatase 2C domain-containing protein [unclassified Leptolyngbya]|uniref:PP2C family protein-serine/threonine phosphatase n=1 Tax=unclassified Leptolyngbya TaxID=2650499 RepID=UPI0016889DB4|nr:MULTISPECIES: protein phosphatase 2C domain-containing protein [unclassified Leptolyngbya]MBD1910949.1 serine/threonine-protein phosphatase [Leptolyngbya sp. FACHB-8]MBD2158385.1 serine/threonine-protein phosphatase [Leptolyngbya sp. FACHB-16]